MLSPTRKVGSGSPLGSLTSAGVQTPASQIQSADGVAQLPVTARPSRA